MIQIARRIGERPWRISAVAVVAALLFGGFVGLSVFTFVYAQGTSYLSNDANACANCHVMQDHLDAWVKSSHGKFATCNDCHSPHHFVGKWYCKSRNGFFHSLAFTTGDFPDRILMHAYNRGVVEDNCRSCHAELVHGLMVDGVGGRGTDTIDCLHCHSSVGHDL